jgi:hypothetical protein
MRFRPRRRPVLPAGPPCMEARAKLRASCEHLRALRDEEEAVLVPVGTCGTTHHGFSTAGGCATGSRVCSRPGSRSRSFSTCSCSWSPLAARRPRCGRDPFLVLASGSAIVAAERAKHREDLGDRTSTSDAAWIVPRERLRRPPQPLMIGLLLGTRDTRRQDACALQDVHGRNQTPTGAPRRHPSG